MRPRPILALLALAILLVVAGCRDEDRGLSQATSLPGTSVARQEARTSATPRPTETSTPRATPTATPTPTITPTPSPTAQPINLDGDPRALVMRDPEPQNGAPCGIVDTLDFPLDWPDAESISRGGQDFGRFRRRYDGYHAGEDWWGPNRRNSFGQPVYSIGHGQVTYANGWGWGADQGVIIIRHTFADGRSFLSFYGHLDPPSVELRAGACVARGEQIAKIGRPRSSPHLHFEIRNHTPDDPGPGYWGTDPTLSGWLPPSQTIWSQRISSSPGVQWMQPFWGEDALPIGLWNGDTLLMADDVYLLGLNTSDGREQWRQAIIEGFVRAQDDDGDEDLAPLAATAAFDVRDAVLYTADRRGRVAAFGLPPEDTGEEEIAAAPAAIPLWDIDFHNFSGAPVLVPIPGGGVAYATRGHMVGLSAIGAILWRHPFEAQIMDWRMVGDQVVLSAPGPGPSLWTLTPDGPSPWPADASGPLAQAGDDLYAYTGRGVFRLDPATSSAALFYALPDGLISQGDILALPDGGLLVAHMDAGGRRLLALDGDGTLRWERAYADLLGGRPHLFLAGDRPFLLSEHSSDGWGLASLYAINSGQAALTHIFSGGTRMPISGRTWAEAPGPNQILINIGGGSVVSLDPQAALQYLCAAGPLAACAP
ncbi:MAG TPA: M23 family metallopeptidase [Candidatus Sulfomarinibacteraceae bacterium]|nr:M23 family metallopeptidase [Candidatus Sulfomarinibacteraceae bacterium]